MVEGGTFYRGEYSSYPATIGSYCLDKYEVTVGRFRAFVTTYDDWAPTETAGEHVPGALTGWRGEWAKSDELPASAAELQSSLGCGSYATWRDTPEDDSLPINCVSWYAAFAFCIWDGARLPTEAEWEYAAAGGAAERGYPWGNDLPDYEHAVYDCSGSDASPGACIYADILPVGSRSAGVSRWGALDLAGSMREWAFDVYAADYVTPCADCAQTAGGSLRINRGGGWGDPDTYLSSTLRASNFPDVGSHNIGFRCARAMEST